MKRFWLNRLEDASGVSGTGIVVEGVVTTSGKCILAWLTGPSSIVIYDTFEEMIGVHGHNGKTEVVWIDG